MSSVADYNGRTVDLSAFQGAFRLGGEELMIQELVRADGAGALVAGIQKLAQRVLVTLLTGKGSKPYRVDDGTAFMPDARRGRWRTVADVEQSFYAARVDIRRQLQALEINADPADECYGGLDLTGVTLTQDKVTVHMRLTSLAGSTFTFLTPIAVNVTR